ncbi:MAG: NUDIX hydrolase [Pseudomonadota bacterium]
MSWPPHVTVATIVQRNDHYLMVEEIDNGRRVINQPAGHLDPNETLHEAAIRETLEETGWKVTLDPFVGIYQYHSLHNDTLYLRVAFTAVPVEQLDVTIDPDIAEVKWMNLDDIEASDTRSPMVIQSIRDAQNATESAAIVKVMS